MGRRNPTVVSIVGARPQFVKLAPLAKALKRHCRHIIIHSGQHYDYELSEAFFAQLHLPAPDRNLNVGSGPHGRQTGRILERCEEALIDYRPEMVLVYGDTNTTLAGAVAAAKLGIPIGHVEAGLRSFRPTMPEEINRRVADHLSQLLFFPTAAARRNLKREGITRGLVRSGDVMYELLDDCLPLISVLRNHTPLKDVKPGAYILVTLHRAENVDDQKRLERFVDLMEQTPGCKLFLVHPHTRARLRRFKLEKRLRAAAGMILGPPLPYVETLALISGAQAVMTDSGGIQKESYFLRRLCLTLRPETEWVETVAAGANILVDLSPVKVKRALDGKRPAQRKTPYRIDGRRPSEIITAEIIAYLQTRR
jgi:UDP-N-acetylglucosamine 2-epimerase